MVCYNIGGLNLHHGSELTTDTVTAYLLSWKWLLTTNFNTCFAFYDEDDGMNAGGKRLNLKLISHEPEIDKFDFFPFHLTHHLNPAK